MESPRPPAPVRYASLAIGAAAALCAVGAYAAIAGLQNLSSAGPALLNVSLEHESDVRRIAEVHAELVLFAGVSVAGLVVLAPLAFAVRRPRQRIRVAAWMAGIAYGAALAITLAGGPDELAAPSGLETPAERAAIEHLLPGWYVYATSLLTAAGLAAVVVFCVALARTTASDFYHAPAARGPDGLWRLTPPAPPR